MMGLFLLLLFLAMSQCQSRYIVDYSYVCDTWGIPGNDLSTGKCNGAARFDSVEEAMRYMNKHNAHIDNTFELYDMIPIKISRVQTGTKIETRKVPAEVEVPVFQWVQQSAE